MFSFPHSFAIHLEALIITSDSSDRDYHKFIYSFYSSIILDIHAPFYKR